MPPVDRLTCDEAVQRLDSYLDRELSPEQAAAVRQHLDICAICAGEYAFEESALRGIREKLHRIHVEPSLLEKVRAAVSRADRGTRS